MAKGITDILNPRKGHFRFESGHHGDLWLDLDLLFVRPKQLQETLNDFAGRLAGIRADGICGPMVGGTFIAYEVARQLGISRFHAERSMSADHRGAVEYRLPAVYRELVAGKSIIVVDDVINAGSAVSKTIADLQSAGATIAGIAAMLVLNGAAERIAQSLGVPLVYLQKATGNLWLEYECPLCAAGVPMEGSQESQ